MTRPPTKSSPEGRRGSSVEITELHSAPPDPRAERTTTRPPRAGATPDEGLPSAKPSRLPRATTNAFTESTAAPAAEQLGAAARLHRQIAHLQERLAEAQRDLSLTNQERAAEAERYDELQIQVINAERHITELDARLTSRQDDLTSASERQAELEHEVQMLRESLQQRVKDEMKRLDAEKETQAANERVLEEQRAAYEAKLVERDMELARLRGVIVEKEEAGHARNRELEAVRATAEESEAKAREIDVVAKGLQDDLDRACAENTRLQSDCQTVRDELTRKCSELEALASLRATLLGIVDGLDRLGVDAKMIRIEAAVALETLAVVRPSKRPTPPEPEAAEPPAPAGRQGLEASPTARPDGMEPAMETAEATAGPKAQALEATSRE